MRDEFSDKYNLVTIQCDYFGYEFMQSEGSIILPSFDKKELSAIFTNDEIARIFNNNRLDFDAFLSIGSKYNINVKAKADLSKENINNFNDMGIMCSL